MKKTHGTGMKFAILALGFCLVFFGSFWVGRYDVSPMQTLRILLDWLLRTVSRGRLFLIQTWQAREQAVVINVRLPRVAAAALVGAALSTAGCSYQGMFRNPMVSPDLLGASTGAGFGAALGLEKLADRGCMKISGGERQLMLLARALVQDASMLIMDEPTANLDYGNSCRVMERVQQLGRQGYTIIFSTHDPNQAFSYATKVLALKDGGVMASGAPRDVLTEAVLSQLYGIPVARCEVQTKLGTKTICMPMPGGEEDN